MDKSLTDLPFVEKTEFDKIRLRLFVKGYWPNPSWALNKILYDLENNTLHVFLVGKSKGELSIQILHPFEEEIDLKKELDEKTQRIIVHSKDGSEKIIII